MLHTTQRKEIMESIYDKNKLTKEQKKCLSLVESLGVYELRALSRIFGGNSPTTQKRNDHIKHIMDKIISKEEIAQMTPLQRLGVVDDIANAVDFLSSEKASFITGQTLFVDGGLILD